MKIDGSSYATNIAAIVVGLAVCDRQRTIRKKMLRVRLFNIWERGRVQDGPYGLWSTTSESVEECWHRKQLVQLFNVQSNAVEMLFWKMFLRFKNVGLVAQIRIWCGDKIFYTFYHPLDRIIVHRPLPDRFMQQKFHLYGNGGWKIGFISKVRDDSMHH